MSLNLARRPFINRRPVQRISVLAWILGLVLASLNAFLYWDYLSGQGATESGLQEVVAQLEDETEMLRLAREQLAGLEANELNNKIEFVNLRIEQRTFSWSRLFDVFAATLPADVRLSSLTPKFERDAGGATSRSKKLSSGEVQIEIRAQAKSGTALLEFLDRLFAHPAFRDPDLHREQTRSDQDVIEFSISTIYLTNAAEPTTPGAGDGEPAAASPSKEAE